MTMKSSYEAQGFKFHVQFVNDQLIHRIKLKNMMTGTVYEAKSIQLIRVKKDTIIAAISKRNPDTIKFNIKEVVDGDKKYLQFIIQVQLDFLPRFDQVIGMQETLQDNNMEDLNAQLQEITTMVNKLCEDTPCNVTNKENCNMTTTTSKYELWKKELSKGDVLLQISGICRSSSGATVSDTLQFQIQVPNFQTIKKQFKTYTNYSYGYPFNVPVILNLDSDAQVKVFIRDKAGMYGLYIERYQVVVLPITITK